MRYVTPLKFVMFRQSFVFDFLHDGFQRYLFFNLSSEIAVIIVGVHKIPVDLNQPADGRG